MVRHKNHLNYEPLKVALEDKKKEKKNPGLYEAVVIFLRHLDGLFIALMSSTFLSTSSGTSVEEEMPKYEGERKVTFNLLCLHWPA